MATSVKISDLPQRAVLGTDFVPVVDAAETQTSIVTAAAIAALGGGVPALNSITTNHIVSNAVTYSRIQQVSATDKILGRSSAGAGVVEEITCTATGRTLLSQTSLANVASTLGVPTTLSQLAGINGTASTPSYSFTSDVNTGMFRAGSGAIGFSTLSTERFRIGADGSMQCVYGGTTGTLGTSGTTYNSTLAPMFTARAWVNFDASGGGYSSYGIGSGAPTIRASGNVSSIIDNGVGNYTVALFTAMPDTNYAVMLMARDVQSGNATNDADNNAWALGVINYNSGKTASQVQILSCCPVLVAPAGLVDTTEYNVVIFR